MNALVLSGILEAEARTSLFACCVSSSVAVRSKRTTLTEGVTLEGTKRKGIRQTFSQYILSLRHVVLNTLCQGGDASHNEKQAVFPVSFPLKLPYCALTLGYASLHTTVQVTRGVLNTWVGSQRVLITDLLAEEVCL